MAHVARANSSILSARKGSSWISSGTLNCPRLARSRALGTKTGQACTDLRQREVEIGDFRLEGLRLTARPAPAEPDNTSGNPPPTLSLSGTGEGVVDGDLACRGDASTQCRLEHRAARGVFGLRPEEERAGQASYGRDFASGVHGDLHGNGSSGRRAERTRELSERRARQEASRA